MTEEVLNAGEESVNEEDVSIRDTLAAEYERLSQTEEAVEQNETATDENAPEQIDEGFDGGGKPRDEKGRFKAKDDGEETTAESGEGKPNDNATTAPPEGKTDGENESKYTGPPPGWSVASKSAFDDLPDSVKSDIAKREREIDQGFAKLKDYKGVEPYVEVARQYNMSLADFMGQYKRVEEYLQQNPKDAILELCETYGVNPGDLAGQMAQQAEQKQDNGADPSIQPLLQKINSLEERLARVHSLEQTVYGDKQAQVTAQVEQFFADPKHKFAENVAPQMLTLINQAKASGQPVDLNQIYETACYMSPEVRDVLIKEQLNADKKAKAEKAKQAANQARQAGASITGGPSATPPAAEPDSENLRALLEQNYAALEGRL